jgi:hypothetical protein
MKKYDCDSALASATPAALKLFSRDPSYGFKETILNLNYIY